jgi:hypothetical protein
LLSFLFFFCTFKCSFILLWNFYLPFLKMWTNHGPVLVDSL